MLNENKEFRRLQVLSGPDHWVIWSEKLRFEGRVAGISIGIKKKQQHGSYLPWPRYELVMFHSRGNI